MRQRRDAAFRETLVKKKSKKETPMSQLHDLYFGYRNHVDMLKQNRAIVSVDRLSNTVKVSLRDNKREFSQVRRMPSDVATFKVHVYAALVCLISHSRRIKRESNSRHLCEAKVRSNEVRRV